MSGINTEHKIHLKVLAPVHIGGAQEKHSQEGVDYLRYDNGETWKIKWDEVYKNFEPDEIANALLKNKLDELIDYELENFAVQMHQAYGSTGEIKTFVRDGFGKAFIPGSSLKGAMKSWAYAAVEKKLNRKGTTNLFGKFDNDIFRFITPIDCYFNNETELYPTKTFNLYKEGNSWRGGWKHSVTKNTKKHFSGVGFVTDFECFSPNSESEFSIKIHKPLSTVHFKALFEGNIDVSKSFQSIFSMQPLNSLFSLINSQVLKHIERELLFFENYNSADHSDEIINFYDNLKTLATSAKEGECLLRLSAGSGFHGISGDHQFLDHINTGIWTEYDARKYELSKSQKHEYVGEYIKFKSRKIAFTPNQMYPMGYVFLSTI